MRGSFNLTPQPSSLVHQLCQGSGVGASAPTGQDFAERMGTWLSVADAIALRTTLLAISATKVAENTAASGSAQPSLAEALQHVRATLIKSIPTTEVAQPTRRRADHSAQGGAVLPAVPMEPNAEWALLVQRHGEQQRRIEMSVDALRAHARTVLSQTSTELAQLAALDAAMDKMLGGREQHVLASVPAFLKKRFEQLRRQATAEEAAANAEMPLGTVPHASKPLHPAWLMQLAAEFEQALLAELDLRLLPVAGMADALARAHP